MFEFNNLSPTDFEDLARDLMQDREGILFESFAPGPDTGIDFRYAKNGENIVIQAKHMDKSGFSKLKSACKKEVEKVRQLNPTRYILVTSVSMTPKRKLEIQKIFQGIPLESSDILGKEDLVAALDAAPEILKRHFKLWLTSTAVMERILKSALYERTEAELEQIKALVPRFVHHHGVEDAEDILDKHSSLVISGPPGIGKSTLARILIWLHMEQGWSIRVIDSIDEAFDALSASGKQLIFFDDFLGQVKITEDLVRGTDTRLPAFLSRVAASKNLRFILTTRDYIYHQAKHLSERLGDLANSRANLVLNIGAYSRQDKAQILFNHIYFSDLSSNDIDQLLGDDFYLSIIDHENFNPRLIEQITKLDVVRQSDAPIREVIKSVLDNPEKLWRTPYRSHFSESDQLLMITLALTSTVSAIEALKSRYARMVKALGVNIPAHQITHNFNKSLRGLEGTTLYIAGQYVRFVNPGVRDFMNAVIIEDGLIALALQSKPSLWEMRQLWEVAQSDEDQGKDSELWRETITSALNAAEDADHEDLALALKLAATSKSAEEQEAIIQLALQRFDACGPGSVSDSGCKAVLDAAENMGLEGDLLEAVVNTLTGDLERCIDDGYIELTVAEAFSFIEETGYHPLANDGLREATQTVGERALDSVKEEISNVSSYEELETLQSEAENLASYAGIPWSFVSDRFDDKRTELEFRDEDHDPNYERPTASGPRVVSDEASIRSLFGTLRDR